MNRPTASSPRNAPPSTEQKYPTFIVITANILLRPVSQDPLHSEHESIHVQQIRHTDDAQKYQSPRKVDAEPPGKRLHCSPLHDLHGLFHSLRYQRGSLRFGVRFDSSGFGGSAGDSDVSTVEVGGDPALFHEGFESNEKSTDDGKGDEEDAGSGVGAARGGSPCVGEERSVLIVVEDHGH